MWHGHYWRDVPGKGKRELPLVLLGERKEMTKLEARKKLEAIIENLGLNKKTCAYPFSSTRYNCL